MHGWRGPWLATVFVAASLCACHGAPPHRPGEEYLDKLVFNGNHAISDSDLKDGLALERTEKRGGAPDPYTVTNDTDRLRGQYARLGYLDADVRSKIDRVGNAATVTFTIVEGVRAKTKIEISGLPQDRPEIEKKVREALPLHDGDFFNYDKYDLVKPTLLGVVEDAGYAHVKLDAQVIVDRVQHQAAITLVYDTGPICRFGAIKIEGVEGELAHAADQRVLFVPGDRYSTSDIADAQRALYGMQRFSSVRITPDKSGGDIIPVTVSITQGARHETTLGGGFGIDPLTYEVRLRAGYRLAGWPTPLSVFSVDLRPAYAFARDQGASEPRVRALASLQRTDLVNPFVVGQIDGGYNYLVVEAYTSYGPLVRLGLTTPLYTQRLKLRVGWRLQYDSFRDISPVVTPDVQHEIGLDTHQRVGAYEQSVSLDLRDNPVETRKGAYFEARFTEGTIAAGGALNFLEAVPEARGYFPIGSTVIAARARVGGIFGQTDADVPVTERFYAGGASSQRGFSERRLAPTVTGMLDNGSTVSVPLGGAAMIDSSIEARQLLGHIRTIGVGGVAFLDGGDVTNTFRELNVSNLHWAAGLGLRLLTIVGAVRFDIGYRLNRTTDADPAPGSKYAFHLSLGEAF